MEFIDEKLSGQGEERARWQFFISVIEENGVWSLEGDGYG